MAKSCEEVDVILVYIYAFFSGTDQLASTSPKLTQGADMLLPVDLGRYRCMCVTLDKWSQCIITQKVCFKSVCSTYGGPMHLHFGTSESELRNKLILQS